MLPVFEGHRLPSIGSRWDIRWVNDRGFTWLFVYLASRLWKGVLRLAVRGNSSSGRVVRRQRVPLFEEHRLLSTEVDKLYGGWAVVEKPVFLCI
jgi:hypothetical protein